jgi:GT2 family glycosyltransferase
MTARVLFVVPTFNRAPELPRTLGAIARQNWRADALAIFVVDNSSTDSTGEIVAELGRTLRCRVDYLRKAPEGPTIARNLGLRRADADYVAFVDSDVELDPDWTAATVAALDGDPRLAQVGGKLVFAHDRGVLNSYGGSIGRLGLAWDHGEGAPANSETRDRDVLWVNTAAVLMRPQAVLAAGGFDERFFYGYEEADLGLRLAIAGWRTRVVPNALAMHHVDVRIGVSHPDVVFHYTKNRVRMGLKCLGWGWLTWFVPATLAYGIADALLHRPHAARLQALLWNVREIGDTWRLRRLAQQGRTLPDRVAIAPFLNNWFPPRRLGGLRRRAVHGTAREALPDDRVVPRRR